MNNTTVDATAQLVNQLTPKITEAIETVDPLDVGGIGFRFNDDYKAEVMEGLAFTEYSVSADSTIIKLSYYNNKHAHIEGYKVSLTAIADVGCVISTEPLVEIKGESAKQLFMQLHSKLKKYQDEIKQETNEFVSCLPNTFRALRQETDWCISDLPEYKGQEILEGINSCFIKSETSEKTASITGTVGSYKIQLDRCDKGEVMGVKVYSFMLQVGRSNKHFHHAVSLNGNGAQCLYEILCGPVA